MIISPRAKEVTNVVRKEGSGFLKINKVLLFRRMGVGSPYRKIVYWERGQNSTDPPPPKLTSFAIVPEMTAAITKGYAVYGDTFGNSNAVNAWRAFDRSATTSSVFGSWAIVTFPEPRIIRGWALQFVSQSASFTLNIEGRLYSGAWTPIFPSSSISPVNNGRFGAITTSMQCTAVRISTNAPSSAVRSCQFFDAVPLVPVTMTSNTAPSGAGVTLISDPNNANLYNLFRNQSAAYTHGTVDWYYNGGVWRSNKGLPSSADQRRFEIHFTETKTVGGFSVGGINTVGGTSTAYNASYCYANCLLIEGRESANDFWQRLDEVEFVPSERRTRYFDFPVNRMVGQLRVTVQDITHGSGASNSASVYLPPMQVFGV